MDLPKHKVQDSFSLTLKPVRFSSIAQKATNAKESLI